MEQLPEAKQKEIAQRAIKDIVNSARLHNMPFFDFMNDKNMNGFLLSVYQAGAKMAMEEMDTIVKQTLEQNKNTNPDDVPF